MAACYLGTFYNPGIRTVCTVINNNIRPWWTLSESLDVDGRYLLKKKNRAKNHILVNTECRMQRLCNLTFCGFFIQRVYDIYGYPRISFTSFNYYGG